MREYISKKPRDYRDGLHKIGTAFSDIARIAKGLQTNQLPRDIIDIVMENETRVSEIHPDNYPWQAFDSDDIHAGLWDQEIDSKAV